MANFQKNVTPVQNKNISKVEGDAFIVATTTNRSDFRDAKQLFKKTLSKALEESPNDLTKIQIYQDAVRGFLLELGEKEPEDQAYNSMIKEVIAALKGFESFADSKITFFKYQMPLLCVMGGLTLLAYILFFMKYFI